MGHKLASPTQQMVSNPIFTSQGSFLEVLVTISSPDPKGMTTRI